MSPGHDATCTFGNYSQARARRKLAVFLALVLALLGVPSAWATSECLLWRGGSQIPSDDLPSPDAVAAQIVAQCTASNAAIATCAGTTCPLSLLDAGTIVCTITLQSEPQFSTFPAINPYTGNMALTVYYPQQGESTDWTLGISYSWDNLPCQVYVTALANRIAQCKCSYVGEPVNPANGAVFLQQPDTGTQGSPPEFLRFYDSTIAGTGDLGPGWRHSYSRSITPIYSSSSYEPYVASVYTSSLYNDEATACTSGFAQIKGQVTTWANATASYANGVCTLTVGTTVIGTLTIYYESQPTPAPGSTVVIAYQATRDDGQVVSFMANGGAITASPNVALTLQATGSGYTLSDESDNLESYDSNGVLLSVTTRAGVVQTVGYDGLGRLSTVTDSFGHRLTLTYNGQGYIASMVRQ